MKWFFTDKVPENPSDILLVESGSPGILPRALVGIREMFPEAGLHLCTCWPHPPSGLSSVFIAADYPSNADKLKLLLSFRKRRHCEVLVVVCSNEPILLAWKIAAITLVPSKVLVVNENADYFWLDWQNRNALRTFLAARWVFVRKEFLLTALRALLFPLTLVYLVASAGWLYARRWRRLLLWKIRPKSAPQQH